MKSLKCRIEKLEQRIELPSDAMSFDIRFVEPSTMSETARLVLNSDGSRTEYEPDSNGGWRTIYEEA